jgi:predicted transcriptional regulator
MSAMVSQKQSAVNGKRFDRTGLRTYTDAMEVKLSPELQARVERIASQQGRDPESLVREAVERLADYDQWFIRQVEKGLAQVDRGEVLEHEEVAARMEKLIALKHRRI